MADGGKYNYIGKGCVEKMTKKDKLIRFLVRNSFMMPLVGVALPELYQSYKLFKKDIQKYNQRNKTNFAIQDEYLYPCLTDRFRQAGVTGLYFWQDYWAAQLIIGCNPEEHYDIGSRIDGFIAHLSLFMKNIHLIDVRPFELSIPGVDFRQADATELEGIENESIYSISALCSLEHFGLGRYGDPIDPEACFKAMKSVERVLASGGNAYISVPIGYEHLEYNAHRVFFAKTVKDTFSGCELAEFSTTDGTCIEKNTPIGKYDDEKKSWGGRFGLFHFVKK